MELARENLARENISTYVIDGSVSSKKRMDLVDKNYEIFKSFIPKLAKLSPNSILLVVSNPVDVLSYMSYKLSKHPPYSFPVTFPFPFRVSNPCSSWCDFLGFPISSGP